MISDSDAVLLALAFGGGILALDLIAWGVTGLWGFWKGVIGR